MNPLSPNETVICPAHQRLKDLARSKKPEHVEAFRRANVGLQKAMASSGTVHIDQVLTTISLQYANGLYIGNRLMPTVTVSKPSAKYFTYDRRSQLAYPDDELGPRGTPNELNQARSTATYSTKGYGYLEYVDARDIAIQDAPLNILADAQANIAEGLQFRQELRLASVMTTAGNYAGNTVALGASDRWDTAGGGDPIGAVQRAKAAMWSGRGQTRLVAFSSDSVFNVLSRHPAILDLFKYGGGAPGLATASMIAGFFGIDEWLISDARKDTANEGQTAVYGRIWPDVFGLVRVATNPTPRSASFGYTFRLLDADSPPAVTWFEQKLGTRGGWYVKGALEEDHKIVAPDTGYLITTPIG